MDHDSMRERENALEEEFFRKQNAEALARLRSAQSTASARADMSAATGISDPEILDRMLAQGLTPATLTAVSLAPLVAVAWADRKLDDRERLAVLEEATRAGLAPETPGYEILEGWLREAPGATLLDTWAAYARGLAASMEPIDRQKFQESLLARAKAVANAAGGGFAGLGSKVSDAEKKVLDQVEAALAG